MMTEGQEFQVGRREYQGLGDCQDLMVVMVRRQELKVEGQG
jgi:hypothetical protein